MRNSPDLEELKPLLGTVLAAQANYYRVRLDQTPEPSTPPLPLPPNPQRGPRQSPQQGEPPRGASSRVPSTPSSPHLLCTRRSRLKKIGQQVMVGDRVAVVEPDWAGGRGAIAEVLPRQTELSRPPIANAHQILLVFAVRDPPLDAYQLSRFLVKAELTGLEVCLCLNKRDLITEQQLQATDARIHCWGYQPLFISVSSGMGLIELRQQLKGSLSAAPATSTELLKDCITVLAGPSGVGKSSLINRLIPGLDLRVGEISGKLSRGRHTTRHVELFELPSGGILADTPGFNQPDIDCSPEDLVYAFPEARQRLAVSNCQFGNCLHRDEPNCVVRGHWERYEHYLEFLAEVIARQDELNQQAEPESQLKVKTKSKGQSQYEPKLETKKYRRLSRRTQQQVLQELYQDAEEA
ncbi:MAG: small ribosomal subunit biogenesis GTPase RsgA [Chroococcidiopsidaceae cyanobacterium CP_BM_ER_R8_30]|nr:small ribosomal subunit biogenesis GTPase RsgA [Chroococcidiopsidaceae cyanobacterium CP_BM_ER_R8_30]